MARIEIEYQYNESAPNEQVAEERNVHAIERIANALEMGLVQGELNYYDSDSDIDYHGWYSIVHFVD